MINKGDKYKCIKDVEMNPTGKIAYKKGAIYSSDIENCLTDEFEDEKHQWNNQNLIDEYFIKWGKEAEKEEILSKANPLLKDHINPDHYKQGKVECIDALEASTINKNGIEAICTANIIKYLWRYESKNGLEDVKKAKWYIERLIKHLENEK